MADQYAVTQFWVHPDTRVAVHVQGADRGKALPSLRLGGDQFRPVVDLVVFGYDQAETTAGLKRLRTAIDLLIGMVATDVDGEQEIDGLPDRWAACPFPSADEPEAVA